jgi:hypothetical protein
VEGLGPKSFLGRDSGKAVGWVGGVDGNSNFKKYMGGQVGVGHVQLESHSGRGQLHLHSHPLTSLASNLASL